MLGLGSVGMVNELFIVMEPRWAGLVVSTMLLMGPSFITAAWQAYNAARRLALPEGSSPHSPTPDPGSLPSQASSSPSQPSS